MAGKGKVTKMMFTATVSYKKSYNDENTQILKVTFTSNSSYQTLLNDSWGLLHSLEDHVKESMKVRPIDLEILSLASVSNFN
jgi:hypothetical protein